MNLLDYIIIITLVFFIIKGIFRGFIREIASLIGIMLGIWLGIAYVTEFSEFLSGYVPGFKFMPLISFAVIFGGVIILCNIAGWGLRFFLKKVFLGWFDKLMGAVFAVFKTVLLTYIAIVTITFYVPSKAPLIADSVLAPWVIKSFQSVSNIFSPDYYNKWKKKILGEKNSIKNISIEKVKNVKI